MAAVVVVGVILVVVIVVLVVFVIVVVVTPWSTLLEKLYMLCQLRNSLPYKILN
jgi:hypothetical protein